MINNLNKILQDPRIISRQIKYIAGFNLNALLNISLIDIRHIEKYLIYNNIKEKLVELYQTRQYQIVLWTHGYNGIQEIIEKLIEHLQLPIIYFISTEDDIFKLPNYGTWKLLNNSFLNLDKNISSYWFII